MNKFPKEPYVVVYPVNYDTTIGLLGGTQINKFLDIKMITKNEQKFSIQVEVFDNENL